jgi:hypothetical protein
MGRLYTESSITARPAFMAMGFRVVMARTVTVRGCAMTNYEMDRPLDSKIS